MHEKLVYKTSTYKIENYIKVDDKYGFIEFNFTAVKNFRKYIVDARSNKKSNGLKAKISQSIY